MAPDLNSVPPSPRPRPAAASAAPQSTSSSPVASRGVSQVMGPPPIPMSSPSSNASGDNTGVGLGPGPLRHPRPMTAADLHLVLEKEQEAVVNRLTRELSLLRQQTASVASTASSTSTGLNDPADALQTSQYLSGPTHPTSSRRHRSSSNLSSQVAASSGARTASVTGIAPSRDNGLPSSRPSGEYHRVGRSRESSVTSPRQPASPLLPLGDLSHSSQSQSHRNSLSLSVGAGASPEIPRSTSVSSSRYEEAAYHRAELEAIKRENEMLRRRVRELEQSLKAYREAQATEDPTASASSLVSGMRDASIAETR
ncbi:hypothetical protein VTN77DRAFT_3542 [Rasamsonia byssochlamydoides]|uniref:uncharacterized protein n=1 Tax=Rasamsonia byssochlamydoides TaxID=89139 RepID=UPI0037431898